MWLLLNLREAEPAIIVGAWLFLFVVVPAAAVFASRFGGRRK